MWLAVQSPEHKQYPQQQQQCKHPEYYRFERLVRTNTGTSIQV